MDTNKKTVGRWLLAAALVGSTATSPVWAQDKVLRLSREMTFRSLDPAQQFDLYSGDITQLVFSSLLTYAHATEPPRLEPDLLARMPTVSADGKTYRFELRPGVRFHDCTCFPGGAGRELTADDVVYTFKRFADANVNVKSWSLLVDTIVGLDEFRAATQRDGAGTDYAKLDIAGIKALGKHEFTIELRAPNATFAHLLAISSLGITPVEAVRAFGADFGAKPVGSGPFMLERADNKGMVRLTKYTRYHRRYPGAEGSHPDAGKPLPLVDVIEMPLVEETQPAVLMLLEGKFDAGTLDRPTFSKMLERDAEGTLRLKPQHAGQYGVVQVPRFALAYVFLNTRDPLLSNRSLREALAHLIDAQAINQVIEGGRHLLASGLVPDGLTGSSAAQPKVRRYDVAAAKAALAKAGYPGGKGLPPLTLSFSAANERMRTIFDLLRMKAAAAGVVLKPNYLDFATYAKEADAGKLQMGWEGYTADYPDGETMVQFLHSRSIGGGWNHPMFGHAAYDRAVDALRKSADAAQRTQLLRQIDAIVRDEVPLVPVYQTMIVRVTQPWVSNYRPRTFGSWLEYVNVDANKKKAR